MNIPARTDEGVDGINVVLRNDGPHVHLDDIATAAEGQPILDELDNAIDHIENQILGARYGRRDNNPDWRPRAEIALRRKRRIRLRLQRRLDDLRRDERAAMEGCPGDGQRKAFVLAAADLLDHEVVTEIWARAREIRPASFGEGSQR